MHLYVQSETAVCRWLLCSEGWINFVLAENCTELLLLLRNGVGLIDKIDILEKKSRKQCNLNEKKYYSDHELITAANSHHARFFWKRKTTTRQNKERKKFSYDPQCVIYAKDSMHVSNKCVSKALPRLSKTF